MDTAKLFFNGRSQAVRLPKEYAFAGDSVHIKKIDGIVMLIPKGAEWDVFERSLEEFSEDYMEIARSQAIAEIRENLD